MNLQIAAAVFDVGREEQSPNEKILPNLTCRSVSILTSTKPFDLSLVNSGADFKTSGGDIGGVR